VVPGSNRGLLPRPGIEKEGILAAAKRMLTESLAISKEIGSRQTTTRFELATIPYHEGDLPHARSNSSNWQQLRLRAETSLGSHCPKSNSQTCCSRRGNVAAAEKMYQDSLAVSGRPGEHRRQEFESCARRGCAFRFCFAAAKYASRRPKSKRCPTNPQLRERTSRSLKKKQPPKDSF
jgi:hypothetical protein